MHIPKWETYPLCNQYHKGSLLVDLAQQQQATSSKWPFESIFARPTCRFWQDKLLHCDGSSNPSNPCHHNLSKWTHCACRLLLCVTRCIDQPWKVNISRIIFHAQQCKQCWMILTCVSLTPVISASRIRSVAWDTWSWVTNIFGIRSSS
jgi:hypothetical protein